jgi:hypothetical protein
VTFIGLKRPLQQDVGAIPMLGAPAPEWQLFTVRRVPSLVVFLRHVGCPFAEATFRALRDIAEAHRWIACYAVCHGDVKEISRWISALCGSGDVHLVHDQSRWLYGRWGLGYTTISHFIGPSALKMLLRLLGRGVRNRSASGTRWQRSGAFAIDADGRIIWMNVARHAGDLPDLADALMAVSR